MAQIVYLLTNEAMPGIVKIGMTTDSIESRIGQLNAHSGVPLPFECFFAAEVDSCSRVEKILHQLFSEHRINPKREFFRIDPEKVVLAISIGSFKDVTPGGVIADQEDKEALEKEKARRPASIFRHWEFTLEPHLCFLVTNPLQPPLFAAIGSNTTDKR